MKLNKGLSTSSLLDLSPKLEIRRSIDVYDITSYKTLKLSAEPMFYMPKTIYLLTQEALMKSFLEYTCAPKIILEEFKKVNILPELGLGLAATIIGFIALICAFVQGEFAAMLLMSSVIIAGLTTIFGSITLKKRIEREYSGE